MRVFLAMQTQWRITAGFNGRRFEGLDYTALREVWSGLQIPLRDRPAIFEGLQRMEFAALPILNERK